MQKLHPLYDDYWKSKNADLSKITVPAFVVACWADHGLHLRGTIEGFKQISSEQKWLLVHGRKKWWHFYQPENVERQRQFFNRFLKGDRVRQSGGRSGRGSARDQGEVLRRRDAQRAGVADRPDPLHPLLPGRGQRQHEHDGSRRWNRRSDTTRTATSTREPERRQPVPVLRGCHRGGAGSGHGEARVRGQRQSRSAPRSRWSSQSGPSSPAT